MDVNTTNNALNSYANRYSSIKADKPYGETLKSYEATHQSLGQSAFLGNRVDPTTVGIKPVQLLSLETMGALSTSARDAYFASVSAEAHTNGQDALSDLTHFFSQDSQAPMTGDTVQQLRSSGVLDWQAAAKPLISQYAENHLSEYQAAASEMGINVGLGGWDSHFNNVSSTNPDDLGPNKPMSDAERIFDKIASPADKAEFAEKMKPYQAAVDQDFASAADHVAQGLQRDLDVSAGIKRLDQKLKDIGVSDADIKGLYWKMGDDGSVQVATVDFPHADEINALMKSDSSYREPFALMAATKQLNVVGGGAMPSSPASDNFVQDAAPGPTVAQLYSAAGQADTKQANTAQDMRDSARDKASQQIEKLSQNMGLSSTDLKNTKWTIKSDGSISTSQDCPSASNFAARVNASWDLKNAFYLSQGLPGLYV